MEITINMTGPEGTKSSSDAGGSLLKDAEKSLLPEGWSSAGEASGAAGGEATSSESASVSRAEGFQLLRSLVKALTGSVGEPTAPPAPAREQASATAASTPTTSDPRPAQPDKALPKSLDAIDILRQNFAKIDAADGSKGTIGNGTIDQRELEVASKSEDQELAAAAQTLLDQGDVWADIAGLDGDADSISMSELCGEEGPTKAPEDGPSKAVAGGQTKAVEVPQTKAVEVPQTTAAAEEANIKALSEQMSPNDAAVRVRDSFDKIKAPGWDYINREALDNAARNKDLSPELRAACMKVSKDQELFSRLDNGADIWNKGDSLIGIRDLNAHTQDTPGEQIGNIFGDLGKLAY